MVFNKVKGGARVRVEEQPNWTSKAMTLYPRGTRNANSSWDQAKSEATSSREQAKNKSEATKSREQGKIKSEVNS